MSQANLTNQPAQQCRANIASCHSARFQKNISRTSQGEEEHDAVPGKSGAQSGAGETRSIVIQKRLHVTSVHGSKMEEKSARGG